MFATTMAGLQAIFYRAHGSLEQFIDKGEGTDNNCQL
jgi:hypothetical protein